MEETNISALYRIATSATHKRQFLCYADYIIAAETLETSVLAQKVKEMVFAEAKKIMDATDVSEKTTNRMAA